MSNYSDSNFKEQDTNSSWYKVMAMIDAKSSILDIGCSSGNFGHELIVRKQCKVDGIEIDDDDYEEAKTKLNKVYQLNIETDDLGIINDKYDYIYFGDVIEHLVWPSKTLKRVKTLLKPTGKILFSIPNMAFIAIRLDLLRGDFEYTETGLLDKTHLHFYTLKEVYRVFNDADYGLEKIDFIESGYSTDYIKSRLDEVGLKGTKKFFDFTKTPEASAFQFVGLAAPGKKNKPSKLKLFSPINGQDGYYKSVLKAHQEELDALRRENENLTKKLNDIYNSKKYKALVKISNQIHGTKRIATNK